MGRLFPSLPRRRSSQPQPRSVYTFHRDEAIPGDRGRGTAYVRNAVVRNRHGDIRYTVATANKQTTVRDRYKKVVARIEWGHTRYPCIVYRDAEVIECCRWRCITHLLVTPQTHVYVPERALSEPIVRLTDGRESTGKILYVSAFHGASSPLKGLIVHLDSRTGRCAAGLYRWCK
ncbi:hypothetical protein PENSPDRAFT_476177 [Peniophora sp. CONT]|nr:hypothetical protein PENSPDRAFT_476177 [Peniophora sp. CONT]